MNDAELHIETTKTNRQYVQAALSNLGKVTDNWPDGSFDFSCYDSNSVDEAVEWLDNHDIEHELI